MSDEYQRKKNKLKKQWSYIDAALKIVQLTERCQNRKYLMDAILKSDRDTFDKLLNDDPTLIDCRAPIGYSHFNLYQTIVERSTDEFIDYVFAKYYTAIANSTDGGKILVPVACERGDVKVLELVLKHFHSTRLDGISGPNQPYNFQLYDGLRPWTVRELEAFESESGLACAIRNDRPDLLSILFRFDSFSILTLSKCQQEQLLHLCLVAEHRQVIIDKFDLKWLRHESLRPCGSIECLRLLIERAYLNPFDVTNSSSLLTLVLEPMHVYLVRLHNKLQTDSRIKFGVHLIRALSKLISKQIQLFVYLISHCGLDPLDKNIQCLDECSNYIDAIFDASNEHQIIQRMILNVRNLWMNTSAKVNDKCLSLKHTCRLVLRAYLRDHRLILVQVEKLFVNLSTSHQRYLKCQMR